ncbi:MAG TPA: DUF2911 domain-containing protein [Candidatus Koribacter sp.]|jgi:hypothetical protein
MRNVTRVAAFFVLAAGIAVAQGGNQKAPASPPGQASHSFDDQKKVSIDYSRPSARGRKIMGELVPYGKVWRTGANSATTLTTDTNLTIGGTSVPSGQYTLYTLPGENGWKLIINKQTKQWGTEYHQEQDLARVDMQVGKTKAPVEQFTISFERTGGDSAKLILEWENTSASVDVREQK